VRSGTGLYRTRSEGRNTALYARLQHPKLHTILAGTPCNQLKAARLPEVIEILLAA